MIDEANTLLSAVILLLAGGMWPVGMGYMFGVCSACCDDCNLCHFHDLSGFAYRRTFQYPNVSMTVEIDGVSTSVIAEEGGGIVTIGNKAVSITGTVDGTPVTVTNIQYRYELDVSGTDPECNVPTTSTVITGPSTASYTITFLARWNPFNTPTTESTGQLALYSSGPCEPLSTTLDYDPLVFGVDNGDGTIESEVIAYLNQVVAQVTLSYDACECGACCNGGAVPPECIDNVAEHLCADEEFQLWKGADTLCDEQDCTAGACCDSGECARVFSQFDCEDLLDGEFLEGVECDPNPC